MPRPRRARRCNAGKGAVRTTCRTRARFVVIQLRARLLLRCDYLDPIGMDANDDPTLMIWHAKPDMSCEYVNEAWREFTGYTLEEARGGGWYRCLHPDDLTRWLDASVRAFD